MGSGESFRRAGVRVYKFEEEKLSTCSKKESLESRLAEGERSRNCSSKSLSILGAEAAMVRMHCFYITRMGALLL